MRNFTRNFKMFTLAIALFSLSAGAVGQGVVFSENFDGFTKGKPNGEPDGADVAGALNDYTQMPGWAGEKVYQAGGAIKMGASGAKGWIETPSIDLSGNGGEFTLEFKSMAWSKDPQQLLIIVNGALAYTITDLPNTADYSLKNYSIVLTGGTASTKIKFEGSATKARFFLEDLKVISGESTSTSIETSASHSFGVIDQSTFTTENINIKGSNLTGDLTISVSGDGFSTTVSTVSQADATAGFDIPVKFAPTARGVFSGQLIISGGGLEDNVNVALSGTAYELIEVNSISQLYSKDVTLANTRYKLTSEAVVTFDYTKNRGQYYIQDATAGLLIDDASKLIATKFSEGDGMKNIEGTLSLYYGVLQFVATSDATKSSTGNSVTPKTITLEQLVTGNYVSQLIKVVNVSISGTGSFEAKKSYAINDDVDVRTFDFTYTAIISEVKNIIGIAVEYTTSTSTKYQISPRSDADLINVPTAIGNLVNDQSIYVQNGQLIVVAQNSGAMVEVYNIAGQRVATQATDAGRNVITLPKGQIYIVKVGNTVKKVAL